MNPNINNPESLQYFPNNTKFESWKQQVYESFTGWLNELSDTVYSDSQISDNIPDLYTFFSSLLSLQTETRKISRKTADSLTSFSEKLSQIDSKIDQFQSSTVSPDSLHVLSLVDRISRIQIQLKQTPPNKRFFSDNRWIKFHKTISEAIDLLMSNATETLKKMRLQRISTIGELFDPHKMVAVDVMKSSSLPDNYVVEEITAGYLHENLVVRLAEVKVVRNK